MAEGTDAQGDWSTLLRAMQDAEQPETRTEVASRYEAMWERYWDLANRTGAAAARKRAALLQEIRRTPST
jgi:hypothetical protein